MIFMEAKHVKPQYTTITRGSLCGINFSTNVAKSEVHQIKNYWLNFRVLNITRTVLQDGSS